MNKQDPLDQWKNQTVILPDILPRRFFFLPAFARRLLGRLVLGHFFCEIAFAPATAGRARTVDAKIF